MLFDHMIEKNNIDIDQQDVRLIQDLILGNSEGYQGKESNISILFSRNVDI